MINFHEIVTAEVTVKCKSCGKEQAVPTEHKAHGGHYTITAKTPAPCCEHTKKYSLEQRYKAAIATLRTRFHCTVPKDPDDMGWGSCDCADCRAMGQLHSLQDEVQKLLWEKPPKDDA